MKWISAWTLAAVLMTALVIGCAKKAEQTVAQAPAQKEPIPIFPEDQVPPAEPQPVPPRVVKAPSPPVDTTATASKPVAVAACKLLPKESYAPANEKAARSYVVRQGDTLQKISKTYYKTTRKWRRIYQANKHTLNQGPDHLPVGTKLVIP